MPRSRQTPPPTEEEGGELTLEELAAELREGRKDLADRLDALEQARSPEQRRRAERDVRQAESGLAKALRDAGYSDISEDDLEQLRTRRRHDEFDQLFDARLEQMGRELEAEAEAAQREASSGKSRRSSRSKAGKAKSDDEPGSEGGEGGEKQRRGYF